MIARDLRSVHAGPFSFAHTEGTLAIVGPSGAGKSLLLRMIADLDPNDGAVSLDGTDRAALSAPAWRQRAMFVPAETGWWAPDIAAHFADPHAAALLMPQVNLPSGLMDAQVARLSSGERARLALLRALARRPRLLMLDEPTGALDSGTTARVEALLAEQVAAGMLLIVATHDPEQPARLGARVMRVANGRFA